MEEISEEELRRQILLFLNEFKNLMVWQNYRIQSHLKNMDALIALGITGKIRDEVILSLALEDYSSGPTRDDYKPGIYWVFGKKLDAAEIYIKLKIVTDTYGNDFAICLSFHPAEYPMTFPFQD